MKIIVTGGASGIGLAISRRLLSEGHKLIICYNSSEKSAKKLEKEYENAYIFKADLTKREDIDSVFDFAKETFEGADALINNAGVSITDCFQCVSDEDYERLMAVNFGAVYKMSAAAVPYMLSKKKGNIINISSIWGVKGAAAEALYSASKAAVISLTQSLAAELAPSGIRVNCIAPGVIDTKMNSHLSDAEMKQLIENIPLGRIGTGEDIAGVVSFLLGESAKYITGQTITVDGGFLNG